MISAYNFPDYLRTFEESRSVAVDVARSNFRVHPSYDAFATPEGGLVMLDADQEFGGMMDLESATLFFGSAN